ncbi:D-alanyl-D-alanine carboxypeptidase/D-alanyl-D-alanine-endopeptidase [Epilithonimonas ginsengisoli]|uniref:D-alanyl-D-alanine carboxypeptidase/D-alanyl-D-alanine-endopeptidase n=1 Tax=Epilithonimonas ginsengisoli TaxID=1245592 RepID=A0ABU4JIH5_9FLAO|nr:MULTISPECIES: D-alanyl-D-alanine carboxypeptidase/D-alanyl-D-alanine-endopeptidase [Chryseobacterium group]MBV6878865.1 D-alanyl-D-alanine carboxypeptidase/D-alanyl-D-alanine-endopeptidase [Epilithonimonas sp. FP105]MDW8549469.1 D-alanyl-D-alanine carboxypeptidase/D-alanyl-D-alanine-endopeptidase [Epilithonimonas ginsengisoli]OAH71654.1 peptidase S13 [Chryseobacterium sp. FP211-J200]
MKPFFLIPFLVTQTFYSQSISADLDKSVKEMMSAPNALAANLSFYVSDESGNLVYEYNGNKGLSTASTQKIFTSAAALETLGKDYQFKTTASYSGKISNGNLDGDLYITSNGDPTLGSWRYEAYKPENFKQKLLEAIKRSGIKKITGNLVIDDSYFDFQSTPGGWPWNDLGNYYGAGTFGVNWRENQFDMNINGDQVKSYSYELQNVNWINELKTGGSSDQSLVFTAPHSETAMINGMLPAGKVTTVSGATPNPPMQLAVEIKKILEDNGISISGKTTTYYNEKVAGKSISKAPDQNQIFEYKSPTLDKIVYWFLRKSINLYGETLIKTMAKEKRNDPSFTSGVDFLKDFWKSKGIHPNMINFADGSGLSPQNYVSAKAQVQALLYSKKQHWFNVFHEGFPTQNGIKMKSGTIKDSKSFAGYHTSKSGKNYVFSIILNNYQGGSISNALFKVLDNLK